MHAILDTETINGAVYWTVQSKHEDAQPGSVVCGETVAIGDVYVGGVFLSRAGVVRGKPARTVDDAKAEKLTALEQFASEMRVSVAGTDDASKLAVYQTKYETALAALAGQQWALTALTPEATARGQTAESLATLVKTLGDQWRAAGLGIDAVYQKHKAAIAALDSTAAADEYNFSEGWAIPGK